MNNTIVSQKSIQYRANLSNLLERLENLATDLDRRQLQGTIRDLHTNINEPLLFVVIGEVKAGKSSFINSLLQADICKIAADTCTDTIQQIFYSDDVFEKPVDRSLRKIGLPNEILKTVSVVDTPGTNTVIKNYQEITKYFIPNSDLIFLIFLAKNPYNRSNWELLDYVNSEHRKKVVFVLQQADLIHPEELAKNQAKLVELAVQKGIESPIVFATSTEYEINGEKNHSGFEEVRNYIQKVLEKVGTKKIKLQKVANISEQIIKLLKKDLIDIQQQLVRDISVVNRIKDRLQKHKKRSGVELKSSIDRLLNEYDSITDRVKSDFREQLSLLTLVKDSSAVLFRTNKSAPTWINELKQSCESQLKYSLGEISQDGIKHFVVGIRDLLHSLVDDLQDLSVDRIDNNVVTVNSIESCQEIVEGVRQKVSTLLDNETFLNSIKSVNTSVVPSLVGGATTISGTAIATLTEIVLLDIIGTAFAGIGILFTGGTLIFKKRKIIEQFEAQLDREKIRFESEITNRLNSKLELIYEEIEGNFVNIYNYVEAEENKILPLVEQLKIIEKLVVHQQALSG